MGDEEFRIIPYEARFERDLVEICWRTGFMGESLEGTGRFDDKKLFALLFVLQFPRTWPETCWLAVRQEGGEERAIGYIVSTTEAAKQARLADNFWSWRWRLILRAWTRTRWRYPRSFKHYLAFKQASSRELWVDSDYRETDYPACLHMNLLPACQGRGLGTQLMQTLLADLRRRGTAGIHLGTSERNEKALHFYRKLGFKLVKESEGEFWLGEKAKGLDFALRLS